jgi:hypothetical protein
LSRVRWRRPRGAVALAAATLLAAGVTACGGGDDPEAPDLPDRAVAVVGDEEITGAELRDQVAALRRAQSEANGGTPGSPAASQLERQALTTLLAAAALEQEAATRGVAVSPREARSRWNDVSRAQFPSKRALRRFLNGQSERDLVEQLRLQLLAERVHAQVAEEAGGGKRGAEAIARFQERLAKRWSERTRCRDGARASQCPQSD